MIAKSKQRLLISIVVGFAIPSLLMAETVVFKNGKKQAGKIISRDQASITLEYKKFGVKIKKKIPLEKIATIDGEAPSDQPGEPKPAPPANRSAPKKDLPPQPKPGSKTTGNTSDSQMNKLVKEAVALFERRLKSKAKETLEKAFKADSQLTRKVLSTGTAPWRKFYHEAAAAFRLRAATKSKDVAELLNVAQFAHETSAQSVTKRALLTVQQLEPANEKVLTLAKEWGMRLTAPLGVNLLPAMTQSFYLDQLSDENHEIKPKRNSRFFVLPLKYDPGSVGLSLSKSSVLVYLDEKKKADRRGFAYLDDSKTIAPSSTDPIWEKVVLSEPKKSRRRPATDAPIDDGEDLSELPVVVELLNQAAPRGVELQANAERIKRDTRKPTGYTALYLQIPDDQEAIWFQFRDRPRQEIDLRWVERAHQPVEEMESADLIAALKELETILESGSEPMAELALAILLEWRSHAGSLDSATAGEQMNLMLVRVLGSEKPGLAEIAWDALVSSPEIDEDLKNLLATKATENTLLGLANVAKESLASAVVEPGDSQQTDGASNRVVPVESLAQSKLPDSNADKNVFDLLAAVGKSPHDAVANRVVDVLLADGTKQSVSVFAKPSPLQALARERISSLNNDELKKALFLTLLTSIDKKDLYTLVKPAESVKLVVDSPTHPLLNLGQKLEDDVSRRAYVAILKGADLSQVLEDSATVGVFRALTEPAVNLKVRTGALNLLLSQWSPNDKRIMVSKGADPPPPSQAVEQLLMSLLPDESPEIFLPACKALIKHGKLAAAAAGMRQLDANTREKLIQTIVQDQSLMANNYLLMFLAGLTGDQASSAAATMALADSMQATPDRWKRMQAIKRYIKWDAVNALAGGGSDQATAAMKVLRNTAGVGTAEQDELREIRDRDKRREKLQEINDRHQKEPSGAYGCVIIAEVMIPEPQTKTETSDKDKDEEASADADMESWRWLAQQRFELDGLKISTPKAQKDQPAGPTVVILGEQKLSTTPDETSAAPAVREITLKAALLLRAALKATASQADNEKQAAVAKKISQKVLPKNATITLKHHQMGTWVGELIFTRSGEAGEQLDPGMVSIGAMETSLQPYLSKITVVLEPIF